MTGWAEWLVAHGQADAATVAEAEQLAAAGADFVALGDFIFGDARGPAVAVAEAARRMAPAEAAG